MSRTLEEILNTPVKFEEGMRVFSLYTFKFATVGKIESCYNHPIYTLDDYCYTRDGKYHENRPYRSLLTEQEAYELFPSLKPKVYEYQVVAKSPEGRFYIPAIWCVDAIEFYNSPHIGPSSEFIELYQPSKRERRS